jgi:O-acetyl-ADP-ribose deacetylase (regulator of RNase III)
MNIIDQDITKVKGRALICHQVNCQRVMGSGLALQIRHKWPEVYAAYRHKQDWRLGDCQIVGIGGKRYVANLAGQDTFGGPNETRVFQLEHALRIARDFADANVLTLYIPYLIGCGLAGGDWDEVSAMIDRIAPDAVICKYTA